MSSTPIARAAHARAVTAALQRAPIVALLGARQCGKTTLARGLTPAAIFDLESSTDRGALAVAPESTLGALRGLVVLDEIQTMPDLCRSCACSPIGRASQRSSCCSAALRRT